MVRRNIRPGGLGSPASPLFSPCHLGLLGTPDLAALQELCREHNATLLVDCAHDLGCIGPDGLGMLYGRKNRRSLTDPVYCRLRSCWKEATCL